MPIALYRIDDRLIHGQVVVGWGKPLDVRFIVLVDDVLASSEWEQELYRMGVPPEMDVQFLSSEQIGAAHARFASDARPGILLTGDPATMLRVVEAVAGIGRVNVGGLHHRAGREQKLRYVFLDAADERALRAIEHHGVDVTAQDVPTTKPVPLDDMIRGETA